VCTRSTGTAVPLRMAGGYKVHTCDLYRIVILTSKQLVRVKIYVHEII
jgi:hypothetical protein